MGFVLYTDTTASDLEFNPLEFRLATGDQIFVKIVGGGANGIGTLGSASSFGTYTSDSTGASYATGEKVTSGSYKSVAGASGWCMGSPENTLRNGIAVSVAGSSDVYANTSAGVIRGVSTGTGSISNLGSGGFNANSGSWNGVGGTISGGAGYGAGGGEYASTSTYSANAGRSGGILNLNYTLLNNNPISITVGAGASGSSSNSIGAGAQGCVAIWW